MKKTLIWIVILGVVGLGAYYVLLKYRQDSKVPIVFAPKTMLAAIWERYKTDYWEKETGRTIDKSRGNVTTSEGQSYTMLRAVWQDDKQTFDQTWNWTQQNLKRPNDNLFSWLYGQRPNGSYGILTDQGGQNTASDADQDIALALVFGFMRWKQAEYLSRAQGIVSDIWKQEVVVIGGRPYLAANNLEKSSSKILINPSYFAPYAYKDFAIIDPQHDWLGLADSSYKVIEDAAKSPLDKSSSIGLPPDWAVIDAKTGRIESAASKGHNSDFSYDALRIPWRLALDWKWNQDERALKLLQSFGFLSHEWRTFGLLRANYTHDGKANEVQETPAFYGGTIGYFLAADPGLAKEVFVQKIESRYSPDADSWLPPLSYYDDNWAWFGAALYYDQLPNLAQGLDQLVITK